MAAVGLATVVTEGEVTSAAAATGAAAQEAVVTVVLASPTREWAAQISQVSASTVVAA